MNDYKLQHWFTDICPNVYSSETFLVEFAGAVNVGVPVLLSKCGTFIRVISFGI